MTSIAGGLEDLADQLGGVERHPVDLGVEYLVGGRAFAVVEPTRAEFRLAPAVADAALRTPGTSPSRRGSDWVALDLTSSDRFTVDRARAWFESAARLAAVARRRH